MKKDMMVSVNFDSFKELSNDDLARIIGLATCALSMRNVAIPEPEPEKTTEKVEKVTKSTKKVAEPEPEKTTEKVENPAYLLREGKYVYKNPDVTIWKKTRWAMTQTATKMGGVKVVKGKMYDKFHDADTYTLVFEFAKVADAKAFLDSQEAYRK